MFVLFVSQFKANGLPKPNVSPNGMEVRQWVKQHFAKGKIPPFSFVYGGKSSESFIKDWQYSAEKIKPIDPNVEEAVYTYSDKQSGLVVKCHVTFFNDFQAVEWVLKLTNNSERNSPLIEKAAVIDYSFISKEKGMLHTSPCQRK